MKFELVGKMWFERGPQDFHPEIPVQISYRAKGLENGKQEGLRIIRELYEGYKTRDENGVNVRLYYVAPRTRRKILHIGLGDVE